MGRGFFWGGGWGEVTRTLLQNRIQLNLHIVVLRRLPPRGLLIPRPPPLRRNTGDGTLPPRSAIQLDSSSHAPILILALHSAVVLGALLVRQLLRRLLGCLQPRAHALGVALPRRLGVFVRLQGFLRFGVEGGGGRLGAGARCVDD